MQQESKIKGGGGFRFAVKLMRSERFENHFPSKHIHMPCSMRLLPQKYQMFRLCYKLKRIVLGIIITGDIIMKSQHLAFGTLRKKVEEEMEKMKKRVRQMERPKKLSKPLQDT